MNIEERVRDHNAQVRRLIRDDNLKQGARRNLNDAGLTLSDQFLIRESDVPHRSAKIKRMREWAAALPDENERRAYAAVLDEFSADLDRQAERRRQEETLEQSERELADAMTKPPVVGPLNGPTTKPPCG